MIIEYTYSEQDLKKRCYKCMHLETQSDLDLIGTCACPDNKIKNRQRGITDRACTHKAERKENA